MSRKYWSDDEHKLDTECMEGKNSMLKNITGRINKKQDDGRALTEKETARRKRTNDSEADYPEELPKENAKTAKKMKKKRGHGPKDNACYVRLLV